MPDIDGLLPCGVESPNGTPIRSIVVSADADVRVRAAGVRIRTVATVGVLAAAMLGLFWVVAPHPVPSTDNPPAENSTATPTLVPDLIYGRVTTVAGAIYEGRLRWNRVEEATWDDEFNGYKESNPWADFVPALRAETARTVTLFGFTLGDRDRAGRLARPFVARFGDLSRIDVGARTITVTSRNGRVTALPRSNASDVDDGLRVWTGDGATVDLDSLTLARIEFLPTPPMAHAPRRLWGTVHAGDATFTGFLSWNRDDALSTDTLDGRTAEGTRRIPYARIRTVTRRGDDRITVTLTDGETVALGGTPDSGADNHGIQIDDPRVGRVHVRWRAFQQVDFTAPPMHRAYGDFPAGQPLAATVSTRDGRTVTGRLVFDLDESETTDILDADAGDLAYMLPFAVIDTIAPRASQSTGAPHAVVTTRGGTTLVLDRRGDLADTNAGLLVYATEAGSPTYVAWADVDRIAFR